MDSARRKLFAARKIGNLAKAAELQHAVIPSLEDEMEEWDKEESAPDCRHHKMLSYYVSADAIATVVARHTGIPVSRITGRYVPLGSLPNIMSVAFPMRKWHVNQLTSFLFHYSKSRKLLRLEDRLCERVVGQDAALSAVSDCVRLAQTSL